jgi:hypothetical protein
MNDAIRFLHSLAQALSTMALYSPGHPAGKRAVDAAWQALRALLDSNPQPAFLFLGGPPVYAGRAVHELADWPWCARLADVAIQRLDMDPSITPEGVEQLLLLWQQRLSGGTDVSALETRLPGVTFGPVEVQNRVSDDGMVPAEAPVEDDAMVFLDLIEEIEALRFVVSEARAARIARGEVEAVARLLLQHVGPHTLAQAEVEDGAEPAAHALNTALLTMAAGIRAGLDEADVLHLGEAAIWHDIGVARLPFDLARKTSLSVDERLTMERHTTLGASLLLAAGGTGLELAAQVAFEHHLRPDRTGYPSRRFAQAPHWASSLIGVAAAYVALRADRPFRAAWTAEHAVAYLRSSAGTVFDQRAAALVAELVAG